MQRIIYLFGIGLVTLASVLMGSCDDSDKLDEFNRLKDERINKSINDESALISKVYSDAVTFLRPDILDGYLLELQYSNNASFSTETYSAINKKESFKNSELTIYGLSPNTTYYYKIIYRRNYYDSEVESIVHSFQTPQFSYSYKDERW